MAGGIGTAWRSVTRRGALALLAVVVAWSFSPMPTAHAADTYQVKTNDVPSYWGKTLNFGASSPDISWAKKGIPAHTTLKNVTWSNTNHDMVPCIQPDAKGGTWSNVLTETFKGVGSYDGKKIDAKVTFKKISVGPRYSTVDQNDDGYMALSYTDGRTLFIGSSSSSKKNARPWKAKKTWDMSIDLVWSDTGKVCDIPFLMDVRDIDQVNFAHNGTTDKKKWTLRWRESFTCDRTKYDRWVYPSNALNPKGFEAKKSENTFSCPDGDDKDGLNLGGDDQLKKGGLYVVSKTGNFTFTYGGGNCLMKVKIYPASKAGSNPGAPRKGALVTD